MSPAQSIPVLFELRNRDAQSVSVAGNFNDWDPAISPLTRKEKDLWSRGLHLAPGQYEYCFVVDGAWILDPLNQMSVENSFGTRNSIFTVLEPAETAHRRKAEQLSIVHLREDQRDQLNNIATHLCAAFAQSNQPSSTAGRTPLGPRTQT